MYRSESYVFDGTRTLSALVREYTRSDFEDLIEIQSECFPPPFPSELWWNEEQLNNHTGIFPEGAHCIEVEGALAGSITGLIVDWSPDDEDHSWADITDNGYIRNHDPKGNSLYVVDISVRPRFRKLGLGTLLMHSMYDVVIRRGLARLLGGARMPGYHTFAEGMSPEQYLAKVLTGEIQDPHRHFPTPLRPRPRAHSAWISARRRFLQQRRPDGMAQPVYAMSRTVTSRNRAFTHANFR